MAQGLGRDTKFIAAYFKESDCIYRTPSLSLAGLQPDIGYGQNSQTKIDYSRERQPNAAKHARIKAPHYTTLPPVLVLDTAPDQTFLRTQRKRRRNRSLECRKVAAVDLGGEPERRIDDRGVNGEEVLRNRARAGVLAAQARDEDGRLAVVVELEVDAALGEDGPLELAERRVLLHGEGVFEHEARLDVGALRQDEEFGRARVDVWRVESTRVHEANGGGEAGANHGGKVGAVREVDLAAGAGFDAGVRGWVEVEFEVGRVHGGEEGVFLHFGRGELDAGDEVLRDGRVGCRGGGGGGAHAGGVRLDGAECTGGSCAPRDPSFGQGGRIWHGPRGSLAAIEGGCGNGCRNEAGEQEFGIHIELIIRKRDCRNEGASTKKKKKKK